MREVLPEEEMDTGWCGSNEEREKGGKEGGDGEGRRMRHRRV